MAQYAANGQGVAPAANPGMAPASGQWMGSGDASAAPAGANGAASLVGAWTGMSQAQGGMARETDLYNADGSFVAVSQAPTGNVMKMFGRYQATPVGPNEFTVQFQLQGVLPAQVCAQTVQGVQCRSDMPPPPGPETVQLTSPTTLVVNGTMTMQRDNAPYLLQANIPQQLVLAPQGERDPVMPRGITRYDSRPAQNFINGRLRGCIQNERGEWVGCEQ